MFGLGTSESIRILGIAVPCFSAKNPNLAHGLGQGIHEFKTATKDVSDPIGRDSVD